MFSARLRKLMEQLDYSQVRLARESGVSQQVISLALAERTVPGDDAVDRLARAMGLDDDTRLDLWLTAHRDRKNAPGLWSLITTRLRKAAGGKAGPALPPIYREPRHAMFKNKCAPKSGRAPSLQLTGPTLSAHECPVDLNADFGVIVGDDAMFPELKPGDVAFFRAPERDEQWGKMSLVCVCDWPVCAIRIPDRDPSGSVSISALKAGYPVNLIAPDRICILGVYVSSFRSATGFERPRKRR